MFNFLKKLFKEDEIKEDEIKDSTPHHQELVPKGVPRKALYAEAQKVIKEYKQSPEKAKELYIGLSANDPDVEYGVSADDFEKPPETMEEAVEQLKTHHQDLVVNTEFIQGDSENEKDLELDQE